MKSSQVSRALLLPILCAVSLLLPSCADSNANTQSKEIDFLQEIYRLTADKSCETSQDCALLAVGAAPCGGPEEYLAYSSKVVTDASKTTQLESHAKAHAEQRKKEHIDKQTMGICRVLPKPSVSCDANMCSAHSQNRLTL